MVKKLNSSYGAEQIVSERSRQVSDKGYTSDHDDAHVNSELLLAATCYLTFSGVSNAMVPVNWPWDAESWSPSGDKKQDLIKAGALIAAEVDRLKRLEDGG